MSHKPPAQRKHDAPVAMQIEKQELFAGPIPSPAILYAYEQLKPGLTERIIAMAEAEAQHRHKVVEMEATTKSHDVVEYHKGVKRGQFFAFIIVLAALLCATACMIFGKTAAGSIFFGTTLGIIVVAFIQIGRTTSKK